MKPRFDIGRLVTTPGAWDMLGHDLELAAMLVTRHVCGDFGDICQDDAHQNVEAIRLGRSRVMSVYKLFEMGTLWVITEADRSVTTLLLPSEY